MNQRRLKLRRGLMIIPGEQAIQVRSLRRMLLLRGNAVTGLLPRLLEFLDGRRTVEEVAASLGEPAGVYEVVAMLEKAGLVEEVTAASGADALPEPFAGLLDSLGASVAEARERLAHTAVAAVASQALSQYLQGCLQSFGVRMRLVPDLTEGLAARLEPEAPYLRQLQDAAAAADLVLVALDRWDPALLRLVNALCVQMRRPWLAMRPESEVAFAVGPFVVPRETACYACLESRRRANRLEFSEIEGAFDQWAVAVPGAARYLVRCPAPIYEAAVAMAVTEAVKYITQLQLYMVTLNQVALVNPFMLQTQMQPVLKVPRCPVCSVAAARPAPRVWMRGE